MNWKEIKEKYPKSARLIWDKAKVVIDADINRWLYDFFDEQGIYISVECYIENPVKFCFTIGIKSDISFRYVFKDDDYKSGLFNSRTEAEEQAFLKAFEILEERLK